MPDNYLERKMEEYRSGKNSRPAVRRPKGSASPGTVNMKFPPRRVFITGGAKGIGRAIVEVFRNADCRVAFCDIDSKAGTATAQATGSRFYPVDVANAEALDACVADVINLWGDIDIIVNNVGVGNFAPLSETSIEDFDKTIATNLRPVFITSRRLAIHRQSLAEAPDYGRIINICSTRYKMSEAGTEGYAASKGGVDALTHALMMSLAPLKITVNAISPGWIENYNYDSLTDSDHNQHPSLRVGRPADISRMCLFLAMPENNFINGENIVIDGGMTRKMIYI